MKEECIKEILEVTKTQVKGYDNSKLIMAILDKFEARIRLDQCEKDEEMVMRQIKPKQRR